MELKLNSKFYAGLALFVSWAIIVAILIAGLVFYQDSKNSNFQNSNLNNNSNPNNQMINISSQGNITLDLTELAKHSASKDCWMLINGKIYDFTNYLYNHPGGAYTITPYCGKDGSNAYATKDKSSPHSSQADSLLIDYYIGDLNQKLSTETVQKRVNQTTSNANNTPRNIRNEEDDD
jgi:cytochrome b involved in lipid metabolism